MQNTIKTKTMKNMVLSVVLLFVLTIQAAAASAQLPRELQGFWQFKEPVDSWEGTTIAVDA